MLKSIVSATTQGKPVGLIVVVHVGVATVEVQSVAIGSATLRTAPIVAVGTSVVQCSRGAVQVASRNKSEYY